MQTPTIKMIPINTDFEVRSLDTVETEYQNIQSLFSYKNYFMM